MANAEVLQVWSPAPEGPRVDDGQTDAAWDPRGAVVIAFDPQVILTESGAEQQRLPAGSTEVEAETAQLLAAGAYEATASPELQERASEVAMKGLVATLSDLELSDEVKRSLILRAQEAESRRQPQ